MLTSVLCACSAEPRTVAQSISKTWRGELFLRHACSCWSLGQQLSPAGRTSSESIGVMCLSGFPADDALTFSHGWSPNRKGTRLVLSGPIPGRGTFYFTIREIMPPKKRKPQKRGPKEERLIIRDDPEQALARLLRPTMPPPSAGSSPRPWLSRQPHATVLLARFNKYLLPLPSPRYPAHRYRLIVAERLNRDVDAGDIAPPFPRT